MTINNIKDLEAVISLCRRKGVTQLQIADLKVTIGPKPERANTASESNSEPKVENQMTDEQLLFWSSGGIEQNG